MTYIGSKEILDDIGHFYPPIPHEVFSLTDILRAEEPFPANALDCLVKIGENIQKVANLDKIISLCQGIINEYDQRLARICKNLKSKSNVYMTESLVSKLLQAYALFRAYKERIKSKDMDPKLRSILQIQSEYYGRIKNVVDCFRDAGRVVEYN